MCRDFTEDDIREVWNSNLSDAQKRFVTAGIVIATAKKYRLHCVLVGGAAVEYYGQIAIIREVKQWLYITNHIITTPLCP